MDKLAFYRSTIKTIIDRYAELQNGSSIVATVPICDNEGDNYLLMASARIVPGECIQLVFTCGFATIKFGFSGMVQKKV
ncbi:MAG: element excision factor XisI family protein [Microcoleus sp.]